MESLSIREHNISSSSGRNFITRKFMGFISRRKREEERKRMDLFKAMRDSSVERLAAVIASARTEFGDRLHDLCSDAEGVLQRMLRESSRPAGSRKVTLRERLLLADVETSSDQAAEVLRSVPTISAAALEDGRSSAPIGLEDGRSFPALEDRRSSAPTSLEDRSSSAPTNGISVEDRLRSAPANLSSLEDQTIPAPTISDRNSVPFISEDARCTTSDQPRLQALLTLEIGSSSAAAAAVESSSIQPQNSSGRRLLSALLFEERISDDPEQQWVAFGVGAIHHRPTSSIGSTNVGSDPDQVNSQPQAQIGSETQTPMRVSLMSLLREAEDGIILQLLGDVDVESSSSASAADVMGEQVCCVCMGRQKGAAFIPCGHTFCRRCCRELQFSRGNCPLCNKEIKDVLNLY